MRSPLFYILLWIYNGKLACKLLIFIHKDGFNRIYIIASFQNHVKFPYRAYIVAFFENQVKFLHVITTVWAKMEIYLIIEIDIWVNIQH